MSIPSRTRRVYLDNAATTPIDERVLVAMTKVFRESFGNPSASHSLGRNAKGILENARKSIASYIGAESREIVFTSGGTEADNLAVRCTIRDLKVKHIITSPTEHKAVLTTSEELASQNDVSLHLLNVDLQGRIDYEQLQNLAETYNGALIALMHANNELGTLIDYKRVSQIAKANNCLFLSDTVQTVGHYKIDVAEYGADFITCSAHKLNGPKGVGFLYINNKLNIKALITGGGQERNLRAGTENVAGVIGLKTALEVALEEMPEESARIFGIKQYMIESLKSQIPEVTVNGDVSKEGGLFTVLNCSLPPTNKNSLLLFQMDMEGVCVSGGSACNSGAQRDSHVLQAIGHPEDRQAMRFSFGRFTTKDEVDFALSALRKVLFSESVEA
jgi:cysteine desulfurase